MRKILFAVIVCLLPQPSAWAQDDGPPYEQRITDAATIAERTKIFANDLKNFGNGGEIRLCRLMVQQAVGVRDGNISYGAICTVRANGRSRDVMMCDDDMFGHFAMKAEFVASEQAVAEFTKHNCYGG